MDNENMVATNFSADKVEVKEEKIFTTVHTGIVDGEVD